MNFQDHVYQIEFLAPKFPSTNGMACKVMKGVSEISLNHFKPEKVTLISEYLKELGEFLRANTIRHRPGCTAATIRDFLHQLELLSRDSRCKTVINKDLNVIKLTNFEGYEGHYLDLEISKTFEATVQRHSLPDKDSFGNNLFSISGGLENVVGQFRRLLEQFSDFYSHLHTIDELCTVVEPVLVSTKHNWRMIRITERVLGKIVIDPFSASAITMNFIGPTLEVEKYRKIYNENIHRWDIDLDVYRNLLRIFDLMYFPMKMRDDDEEEKYCNICYMYMLDDHIPLISCDNPRCDLIFHVACLKEWFSTLDERKTFLAVTFGSCPSCKEVSFSWISQAISRALYFSSISETIAIVCTIAGDIADNHFD